MRAAVLLKMTSKFISILMFNVAQHGKETTIVNSCGRRARTEVGLEDGIPVLESRFLRVRRRILTTSTLRKIV